MIETHRSFLRVRLDGCIFGSALRGRTDNNDRPPQGPPLEPIGFRRAKLTGSPGIDGPQSPSPGLARRSPHKDEPSLTESLRQPRLRCRAQPRATLHNLTPNDSPKEGAVHTARSQGQLKEVLRIRGTSDAHWVGDGFPVRTLFSCQDSGKDSPFLLLDYAGPREFSPTSVWLGVGQHPRRGFDRARTALVSITTSCARIETCGARRPKPTGNPSISLPAAQLSAPPPPGGPAVGRCSPSLSRGCPRLW